MAFRNVGGISRPFTAVGESLEPLARALERMGGLQGAFARMASVSETLDAALAQVAARTGDLSIAPVRNEGRPARGDGVHSTDDPLGRGSGEEGGAGGAGRGFGSARRLGNVGERSLSIAPFEAADAGRRAPSFGMKRATNLAMSSVMSGNPALAQTLSALTFSEVNVALQSVIGAVARKEEASHAMSGAVPISRAAEALGLKPSGAIFPTEYGLRTEQGPAASLPIRETMFPMPAVGSHGSARLAHEGAKIGKALAGVAATFGRMTVLNKAGLDFSRLPSDGRGYGAHAARRDREQLFQRAAGTRGMHRAAPPAVEPRHFAELKSLSLVPRRRLEGRVMFAETNLRGSGRAPALSPGADRERPTALLPDLDALRNFNDRASGMMARHSAGRQTMEAAGGAGLGAAIGDGSGSAAVHPHGHMRMSYGAGAASRGVEGAAPLGLGMPESTAAIHIEAPLTVTVQGDMLGDHASLSMLLSRFADEHARTITDAVTRKLRDRQNIARRGAMLDWGNADVHLGGAGPAL